MKGYLINALDRTITAQEYQYGDMTKWMPGGICIATMFENGDVLFVDDEGLLRPADRAFRIRRRIDGQPMMSNGFLTGRDDMESTLPPTFTIDELAAEIEWLDVPDALRWFKQRESQPAVTWSSGESAVVTATWRNLLDNLDKQN